MGDEILTAVIQGLDNLDELSRGGEIEGLISSTIFKQSLVGNNLTLINDFNVQCKLQLANHMQVK